MTREAKSKLKTNILEWVVKPAVTPILLAIVFGAWTFFSDEKSSTNVNASEVVNIKKVQDKLSQDIFMVNSNLDAKVDELKNNREHSEVKAVLDRKADKEDVEELKKSVQRIDDRTYQILILLQKQ